MKRAILPLSVVAALMVAVLMVAGPGTAGAAGKKPPAEWDGLTLVKVKDIDAAYVRPGADISGYTKIIIDPFQVAFSKDWDKKTTNNKKVPAEKLEEIKQKLGQMADEIFKDILSKDGGYQVVTTPGPDVMHFSAAIIDVWPRAVDTLEPGRSYTFTTSSGSAVLYAEFRDSETSQLFGRVVDGREARNSGTFRWTNSVENNAEARMMVANWAKILRKKLDAVRANGGVAAAPK